MKTTKTAAPMASYQPSPADMAREQEYQAQQDVRTLADAHKIRQDPTRHAAAKNHLAQQLKAMKESKPVKKDEKEMPGDKDKETGPGE